MRGPAPHWDRAVSSAQKGVSNCSPSGRESREQPLTYFVGDINVGIQFEASEVWAVCDCSAHACITHPSHTHTTQKQESRLRGELNKANKAAEGDTPNMH